MRSIQSPTGVIQGVIKTILNIPVGGGSVSLYDSFGITLLQVVAVDLLGNYTFSALVPGSYTLKLTPTLGWIIQVGDPILQPVIATAGIVNKNILVQLGL